MKPSCGPGARLCRVVEGFPRVTQRGDTSLRMNPRLHVLAHEPALNMCQHSLDKPVSDMEATRTYSQIYELVGATSKRLAPQDVIPKSVESPTTTTGTLSLSTPSYSYTLGSLCPQTYIY